METKVLISMTKDELEALIRGNLCIKKHGLPPEDYLFWTSVFGKNWESLQTPVIRLVKDSDIEHISKLPKGYMNTFNNIIIKKNKDLLK